jgi:hypothetical protein
VRLCSGEAWCGALVAGEVKGAGHENMCCRAGHCDIAGLMTWMKLLMIGGCGDQRLHVCWGCFGSSSARADEAARKLQATRYHIRDK